MSATARTEDVMNVPSRCARRDTDRAAQSHVSPAKKEDVMRSPYQCARGDTDRAAQSHVSHRQY